MNLYHKVKQQALYPTCIHSTQQQMVGLLKAFETPYVVRPNMVSQIYATQDCWSFTHEPWHPAVVASSSHIDLERYVHLEFGTPNDNDAMATSGPCIHGAQYGTGYGPCDEYVQSMRQAVMEHTTGSNKKKSSITEPPPPPQQTPWTCTGLLGTFTADLYHHDSNDVAATTTNNISTTNGMSTGSTIQISTNPNTFSTGMFSWFPLYFPSLQPIQVPKYGVIHVDIWRKCSLTKVWYEWMFTVRIETPCGNDKSDHPTHHMDMNDDDDDDNMVHQHQQLTTPTTTHSTVHYVSPIHNPGGRSSFVSLLS